MTTFDTAKIRSIDRTKGRIELSMRNGLVSVGTYPYDIANLREGMSVLIGKVDNSHVILNQVENVPRLGTSYSVRRPVVVPPPPAETGQILILNFEGEDGATSWIEEAQGLSPSYISFGSGVIDTNQYYTGNSSLRLVKDLLLGTDLWISSIDYTPISGIGNNVRIENSVRFSDIPNIGTNDLVVLLRTGSIFIGNWSHIRVYLFVGSLRIEIRDHLGNSIADSSEEIPFFLTNNTWHKIGIVVEERDVYFYINDVEFRHWVAEIDNPFLLNWYEMYNCANTVTHNVWYDKVSITNL